MIFLVRDGGERIDISGLWDTFAFSFVDSWSTIWSIFSSDDKKKDTSTKKDTNKDISDNISKENSTNNKISSTANLFDASSTMVSLDTIIQWLSNQTQSQTNNFISTEQLLSIYETNPSVSLAQQIIQQLVKESDHNRAWEFYQQLERGTQKSIDTSLVLRMMMNIKSIIVSIGATSPVLSFINQSRQNGSLSQDEAKRYQGLLSLTQWKQKIFLTTISSLSLSGSQDETRDDIMSRVSQAKQGRDIPEEYADGMIALALFQHGYTTIAQQFSLAILQSHPNYILPKQILAYTHIVLHDRREAKSYFLDLMTTDPGNIGLYQFFVGVSSYWMKNPTDAILYLSQIPNEAITSDVIRYKILSYISLNDTNKLAESYQQFLSKSNVNAADLILFWETTIFEPYMRQAPYTILQKNQNLLSLSLQKCKDNKIDNKICSLGMIGQQVTANQYAGLEELITPLLIEFPRSYFYVIIAESYKKEWKINEAKKALIQARALTKDSKVQGNIMKKLQLLL